MKLYIKNMESAGAELLARAELKKLNVMFRITESGDIVLNRILTREKHKELVNAFNESGIEIMNGRKFMLVENIKSAIINMIYYSDELPRENYSVYLSRILNHNYTYLANVFSEIAGITIEHFIINQKIEKVKEFLRDDKLNLTEISYAMKYSSVAHLSSQFKKVTGITPTAFKNIIKKRKALVIA